MWKVVWQQRYEDSACMTRYPAEIWRDQISTPPTHSAESYSLFNVPCTPETTSRRPSTTPTALSLTPLHQTMPSLQSVTTQYPVLTTLSSWLSTLDLYHLSLASKHFNAHILASKSIFDHLKRTALCDGRGLQQRQNFQGPYRLDSAFAYTWGNSRKIWADEPVEVRLWNIECDAAGALPCRKCGINVCEECRRYRREPGR